MGFSLIKSLRQDPKFQENEIVSIQADASPWRKISSNS